MTLKRRQDMVQYCESRGVDCARSTLSLWGQDGIRCAMWLAVQYNGCDPSRPLQIREVEDWNLHRSGSQFEMKVKTVLLRYSQSFTLVHSWTSASFANRPGQQLIYTWSVQEKQRIYSKTKQNPSRPSRVGGLAAGTYLLKKDSSRFWFWSRFCPCDHWRPDNRR